jgi:hypothetical protein
MTDNERQQRMAERILEDERLRGDLEDDAASALVDWASKRAVDAAADPARPDDVVEAQVQQIRQAARAAALSGESDPRRLIAVAESKLRPGVTLSSDTGVERAPDSIASEIEPAEQPIEPATPLAAAPTAARSVGEELAKAAVATTTSQPATPPQPAHARPRRRRNRLARFLKRLRGAR